MNNNINSPNLISVIDLFNIYKNDPSYNYRSILHYEYLNYKQVDDIFYIKALEGYYNKCNQVYELIKSDKLNSY